MTRRNALLLAAAAALAAPVPASASNPLVHDCYGYSHVREEYGFDEVTIHDYVISPAAKVTVSCGFRRNGTMVYTTNATLTGVSTGRWDLLFTPAAGDVLEVCARDSTSPVWSCKPLVRIHPVAG